MNTNYPQVVSLVVEGKADLGKKLSMGAMYLVAASVSPHNGV
jgi:hypothetical protein